MENRFSHVALIGKYRNLADTAQQVEQSLSALRQVAAFLQQRGCRVSLEQDTAACVGAAQLPVLPLEEIGRQCDLALVVGGDGTFLHVACKLAPFKVPLIGINQGRLGFVTDIALEGFEQVLSPMLCGRCQWEERRLLQATAWRGAVRLADGLALNDVVLYRGSTSGMVEVRVEVDGQFVANQRADGLIVSTATGSTAYALSVGGPMMHPDVNALLLVPIAPHTLSNRPIILPGDCEVTLRVAGVRGEASASFDMTSFAPLLPGDCVTVRSAEHAVRLLHPEGWSYFDTLRNKLHWNTGEQP